MKKIFAMLIAVAVLLSLAVIGVSADEGRYVYNHTGDPNLADPFNSSMRIGHDSPTTVTVQFQTDVSFSKVFFPKIWCKAHSEVTIEILSGEEVVASKTFEAYNEANGSGDIDNVEVDFGKTVPAGPLSSATAPIRFLKNTSSSSAATATSVSGPLTPAKASLPSVPKFPAERLLLSSFTALPSTPFTSTTL